ncbi:hypothetical protein EX30DRAFT_395881 [Ascodesmis nigricans]|uniref:Uncharacterized protein n=1 Tax=Ascodesmis nigricans TaxID=341454 RepID=A0A4S2MWR6_9PEZI|nr:hypothetical protein EX30DRAFT_395881 [Ascodesmis nigricans]
MAHAPVINKLPRPVVRQQQQHRHSKSEAASFPHHQTASQPRHLPHHAAHQQQTPPSRGLHRPNLPPHTTPPQAPQFVDNASKKKKRSKKPNQNTSKPLSPESHAPAVDESIIVPTPQRVVPIPAAVTPPSPVSTPTKAPVYAGPTFHQSPAPSSLPVPKFFSKSAPPPQDTNHLSSLDNTGKKVPDSPFSASPMPLGRQEDPLERLFRADREEKERKRVQSDDSSDNDSSDSATDSNSSSGVSGDCDSPFTVYSTPVRPRPQTTRTTTEPLFSMDVEKAASKAMNRGQDPATDTKYQTALLQYLYQSPLPMRSPVSQPVGSISPSPAGRAAQSPSRTVYHNNHAHLNGSPLPARRLNYCPQPAAPPAVSDPRISPPPRPNFRVHSAQRGPNPIQQHPTTPPRQTARERCR